MLAVIRLDSAQGHIDSEQRATPRSAIALPILIVLGGKRYSATLRNLSSAGAMIVTSAPLTIRSRIEFQCGTICSRGIVLWQRQSDFGIKFRTPICERQLSEQISRSAAVARRRALGPKPAIVHLV
jgi:hypothetical protein